MIDLVKGSPSEWPVNILDEKLRATCLHETEERVGKELVSKVPSLDF